MYLNSFDAKDNLTFNKNGSIRNDRNNPWHLKRSVNNEYF